MSASELEVTIEIRCTHPPAADGAAGEVLHLGIQQGTQVTDPTPVNRKTLIFRALLRARLHTDGSANFLGPFAQGPRAERFIYLKWVAMKEGAVVAYPGRIKLHLSHLPWSRIEAAASARKPIMVTLALTNAKGKPVYASVREGVAQWHQA
ncbi:MAG: DUF5990 family protein [Steroidobacteraceae bacterium]